MSHNHTNFLAESKGDPSTESGFFLFIKHPGETLSDLLKRFRKEKGFDASLPITYAGRLDPMAEGLVILLTGERCKEKDNFLVLPKTYIFQVLFGVATDSFDMLGVVTKIDFTIPTEREVSLAIELVKNKKVFPYPPFSSKPVFGMPLFAHARKGTLPEELPVRKGGIKKLSLLSLKTFSAKELVMKSIETIQKVTGDFRQEKIISEWQDFLEKEGDRKVLLATLEATVSSGVYIRSIAVALGEALGTQALAYIIDRTAIGDYKK